MNPTRPLDDQGLVKKPTIRSVNARVENPGKAKQIVSDIRANEPDFDDYLASRIEDHIDWLLSIDQEMPDEAVEGIRDCLYKFAIIGFMTAKETYSTTLPEGPQ